MRRAILPPAILLAVTLPAAACASSAAPPAPASQRICTTKACIVSDLDKGLTGDVAKDESVAVKVDCARASVVYHQAADTYSASCTVTYSDGTTAAGTGNLLIGKREVTFAPAG